MGSITGGVIQPIQPPSLVGSDTQNNFLTALFGQGLQQNPQGGGMMFAGVPAYQGPLSPNINDTILPSVYGSYNPATAGAPAYSNLQSINAANQGMAQGANPINMMNQVQQYGGMSGFPLQLMHNMAQYGTTGYSNPLAPFMNAQAYSSRR